MGLTLDQVRTLDAIEAAGSFAAAAKKLNKTQSAISYDVRQLETVLGIALFDRAYRARLTEAGREILREGRHLLARAQHIDALAESFRAGWETRLMVVIDGILPMEPIMRALKELTDRGVPTRIQVKVEFLGGVQFRYEREGADMMLVKEYQPNDYLTARPLPDMECVLVAAADHPLNQGRKGTLSLPDLQSYVELTVHDSSESGEITDRHQFGGTRVYFLSDFYTKRQALLMGLGFGWMPTYMVRDDIAQDRLRKVPFRGGNTFHFQPHLVHPAERPLGNTGALFLELITKALDADRRWLPK